MSIITIATILVALGCYAGAVNNVPVLAPTLYWVAVGVYHFFPALKDLHQSQVRMLVSAATVGIAFFFLTIPLVNWLAGVFTRAGNEVLRDTIVQCSALFALTNRIRPIC